MWHWAVALQENPLVFPTGTDFMVSQPGISGDMALLSPASMLICIGHTPVKPLAASPLMGSAAQSNRRNNVRSHFMAGGIKGKHRQIFTPAARPAAPPPAVLHFARSGRSPQLAGSSAMRRPPLAAIQLVPHRVLP